MERRHTAKRAMAAAGALVLAAAGWMAPAAAAPGEGGFGPGRLSVRGAAMSEGGDTSHGLGVWARTAGGAEEARGQFRFGHQGPDGEWGVAGHVRCLTRDDDGLVQVSGVVFGSGGRDHVGDAFAATVDVDAEPQRFSDLRLGEPGTVGPCSGGGPGFHTVTRGGYQATGG